MSCHSSCSRCGTPLEVPGAPCLRCLLGAALTARSTVRLGPAFLDDLPISSEQLVIAGKYTVIETIARGGMGVVYKARQENLNRIVAVKMLLGGVHASDDYKRRFLQEAKAAAHLDHPNIVSIHDWGDDAGQPYFSMDYVEGTTLADLARTQPMQPRAAADMVRTVAKAIQHAHERGVLHRDLKPSNVLVDSEGVPHVTDFGLARNLNHDTVLTLSGDLLGTPGYLPPEQVSARREKIGARSDVYGLGALLYCLLTGRPPHFAGSATEALRAVVEDEPVPPRRLNSTVPRDLETICLKCLEKDPARRYPTALALAGELERWLNGEAILAKPVSSWTRVVKWSRRKPALATAIAFSTLVLSAGVVSVTWQWQRAETAYRIALLAAESERTAQRLAEVKRIETENALARLKTAQAEAAAAYHETLRLAAAEAEARKLADEKLTEARLSRLEAERMQAEADKAAKQAVAAQKDSADSVLALASANRELTVLQIQASRLSEELEARKILLNQAEKKLSELEAAATTPAANETRNIKPATAPDKRSSSEPRIVKEARPGIRNNRSTGPEMERTGREAQRHAPSGGFNVRRSNGESGFSGSNQRTRSNPLEQALRVSDLIQDVLQASNEVAGIRLGITNLVRKLPALKEFSAESELASTRLSGVAENARAQAASAVKRANLADGHALPFLTDVRNRSAELEEARRKLEAILQKAQESVPTSSDRNGQ